MTLHTSVPLPSRVRQIDSLQILRAVAVILVTWGHAGLYLEQRLPDFFIYGIDIFFVISGFIMSYIVLDSPEPPGTAAAGEFLRRRLIRIYPIYWLFALLGMLRLVHNHTPALYRYAGSLFLLPNPQWPRVTNLSWTLIFEMFFYCAMAATLLFSVRRAVPLLIGVLTASSGVGTIWRVTNPVAEIACNPILMEFVFGAIIGWLFYRFGRRRPLGMMLLALGMIASFCLRLYPAFSAGGFDLILRDEKVAQRSMTWGLGAALLVAGLVFWSPEIKGRIGLLGVITGNASYSSYLASTLVLEFALRLLLKISPSPGQDSLLRVMMLQVGMTLAVLLAGWLSYQFVEWPMVRALQRRFTRRAGSSYSVVGRQPAEASHAFQTHAAERQAPAVRPR